MMKVSKNVPVVRSPCWIRMGACLEGKKEKKGTKQWLAPTIFLGVCFLDWETPLCGCLFVGSPLLSGCGNSLRATHFGPNFTHKWLPCEDQGFASTRLGADPLFDSERAEAVEDLSFRLEPPNHSPFPNPRTRSWRVA